MGIAPAAMEVHGMVLDVSRRFVPFRIGRTVVKKKDGKRHAVVFEKELGSCTW